MQVVLVYLEWFRRNSFLKCVLQPDLLLIITSTADELSSGTNTDDLEPQNRGF